LLTSVADPDPGSGAFLTPGSWIRIEKKSRSGLIIPDHFYESLEIVFIVKKYLNSFVDADPDPGSGILLTMDPGWKNSDPG
jgi:hypothetical protein